ncbi:phage tail domain-containing protein [Halobacillus ihumii]|uniref:phage tail domain-containing protein n=1 Tax=Halobacillus ihumii TaxID=2686092 RepID=UPI0013D1A79A|nr:phage tail domain-containing protein [Halobacillus ihumii]
MIKLDGNNLREFDIELLENHQNPMSAPTREKTLKIPGRKGVLSFGTETDPKPLNLPLGILPQANKIGLHRKIEAFDRFISDDWGNPREMKLVYDYNPDKYYMIKKVGEIPIERFVTMGSFELPIIAHDPQAKLIVENHEISWDSTELTYDSSVSMDHYSPGTNIPVTAPTSIDYYVNGYAVRPTIIIEGSADSLTVSANGQSFSLGSFTNTKYEVIGQDYTIKKNNTQNGMPDLKKDSINDHLELLPGDNTVNVDGSGLDITFSLIFRDQY